MISSIHPQFVPTNRGRKGKRVVTKNAMHRICYICSRFKTTEVCRECRVTANVKTISSASAPDEIALVPIWL